MRNSVMIGTIVLIGLLLLPRMGRAQGNAAPTTVPDPLALYPQNYTVLFENDRVRVLDFRLAKGASEKTHRHPANVAVFLKDVKIRFTLPDGQTKIREARAGEVSYSEATAHASENIGDADAHGILVELKQSNHADATPGVH